MNSPGGLGWSVCTITAQAQEEKKGEATPEEQALFDAASKENTPQSFTKYLQQYPNGKYASEAKLKIETLVWEWAKESDYFTDVEKYLRGFPDGKFVSEAKQKIVELEETKCQLRNTDEFIAHYEERYNETVAPANKKYNDSKGFDRVMAKMNLIGTVLDQKELDAVWAHCYAEKANTDQKEQYLKYANKVDTIYQKIGGD